MTSQSDGTLYGKGLPLEFDRNLGWKRPTPKQSDAGYDLEDVAEHYKELIQDEATAIMKQKQHNELKTQIQKDLDNLAVIDRNNTIVFPLELAGRTYNVGTRNEYFEEILQKRLERRNKVNKLRESVLQHNLDDITEHVKTILDHDKKEEEAFTSQFK